ncbi:transposase [Streptomyces violascens]|uniref:transposase n=1 Tax=Streptomyces violascens TaxID=67381 RepID=UPI0036CAD5F0
MTAVALPSFRRVGVPDADRASAGAITLNVRRSGGGRGALVPPDCPGCTVQRQRQIKLPEPRCRSWLTCWSLRARDEGAHGLLAPRSAPQDRPPTTTSWRHPGSSHTPRVKSVPVRGLAEDNLTAASPDLLRAMGKTFAGALMSAEADALCNAEYGQASGERVNHRNGYRPREWRTRADTVELAIPKVTRSASCFPPCLLERRHRTGQVLISCSPPPTRSRLPRRLHSARAPQPDRTTTMATGPTPP